jgi:hypothetical protein
MEHETHRVGRPQGGHRLRIEEPRLHPGAALVRLQHVPVAVEHEGRIRLLLAQDEVECAPDLGQRRSVEPRRPVDGRVAGGREQIVAVAQRHVERTRQQQDHFPARLRPTRLDEAEVPRRHARLDREVELAQPPARPPVAQQRAEAPLTDDLGVFHAGTLHRPWAAGTLPGR